MHVPRITNIAISGTYSMSRGSRKQWYLAHSQYTTDHEYAYFRCIFNVPSIMKIAIFRYFECPTNNGLSQNLFYCTWDIEILRNLYAKLLMHHGQKLQIFYLLVHGEFRILWQFAVQESLGHNIYWTSVTRIVIIFIEL